MRSTIFFMLAGFFDSFFIERLKFRLIAPATVYVNHVVVRRIDVMVAAARARQDFTHFVSLPINSPDIQAEFLQFKSQVLTIKLIFFYQKLQFTYPQAFITDSQAIGERKKEHPVL
jgi:hypothetical protein